MRRSLLALVVASMLLVAPRPVSAAVQVTLTVAPASVVVGQPAEVLLRTFVPTEWEGLGMEAPGSWPFVPDVAYVLWPVPDYPFSVVAQADDGAEIPLVMTLDPADPTLWRGVFVPDRAGMWRVRATNFAESDPGANVTLTVVPAPDGTSVVPDAASVPPGDAVPR